MEGGSNGQSASDPLQISGHYMCCLLDSRQDQWVITVHLICVASSQAVLVVSPHRYQNVDISTKPPPLIPPLKTLNDPEIICACVISSSILRKAICENQVKYELSHISRPCPKPSVAMPFEV